MALTCGYRLAGSLDGPPRLFLSLPDQWIGVRHPSLTG